MKVARILQFLVLLALAGYLLLLHNGNAVNVNLPFLIDLPAALVLAVALALGWFLGWFPAWLVSWRKERELRRLRRRLAELEQRPDYQAARLEPSEPVIPDRTGVYPTPKESPDYENF